MAWLYHATPARALPSIAREGLRAGCYLAADEALLAYYVETIEDGGEDAVVLRVDASALEQVSLAPDRPGLDEPIMTTVRARSGLADEEAVWQAWQQGAMDAAACLALIGSCRCEAAIPPHLLQVERDSGCWAGLSATHPPRLRRG